MTVDIVSSTKGLNSALNAEDKGRTSLIPSKLHPSSGVRYQSSWLSKRLELMGQAVFKRIQFPT